VEDKTEVNLQINNNKKQPPPPTQPVPVDPDSCVKCHQPLEGEVIEALEKPYHQKCFGCHKCGRALKAKFVPVDGWPYCEGCGRQAFVTSRLQRRSQAASGDAEQHNQLKPPAIPNHNRIEMERQEKEREEREKKAEQDRKEREDRERKDKQERERKEKEDKEKKQREEKERQENERKDKEEKDKKQREEKEKQLKAEKEEHERKEKDRIEREKKEKQEAERKDKEKLEAERKEREKQEQAKRDKEKHDQESKEKESDRIRREREEKMQKEREEAERVEREREEKKEKERPKTVVLTLNAPKLDKNSGNKVNLKIETPEKANENRNTAKSGIYTTVLTAPSQSPSPSPTPTTPTSQPLPTSPTTSSSHSFVSTANPPSASPTHSSTPSSQSFNAPSDATTTNRKSTYIQEHIKNQKLLKEKKEAEEREEKAKKEAEDKTKKEVEDKTKKEADEKEKQRKEKEKKDAEERTKKEKEEKERKERAAVDEVARKQEQLKKQEHDKKQKEDEARDRERKEREVREQKEKEAREHREKEAREQREKEERERAKERDKEQDRKKPSPKTTPLKREQNFSINVKKDLPPLPTATPLSLSPAPTLRVPSLPLTPTSTTSPSHPLPLTPTSTPPPPSLSPAQAMDMEKVLLEGFLMKQQANGFRMWQQRYFILYAEKLVYFRSHLKPNTPPHGIFSVRLIHSIETLPGSKFAMLIEDKVWNFEAETDEEKDQWVSALNTACKNLEPLPVPALSNTSSSKIKRKEGWLNKLGFFGFSKVWVVLRAGVISYSETEGGKQLGRVLLYKCHLEEYDPKHKQNCFMATPLHESSSLSIFKWASGVVFQAKDEMDMHEWLNEVVKQKVMIEDIIDNFEVDE